MTLLTALLLGAIEISSADCSVLDVAEVQRIAEVELSNAPPTATPIRALVRCDGATAELTVDDPVTNKTLGRKVSLMKLVPRAQPRVLALAIAELVSASWSELLLVPRADAETPKVEPEVRAKALEALPPEQPRGVLRLEAVGAARWLPASAAVQWGGGARVIWVPVARWGLWAEVTGEHGAVTVPSGRLTAQTVGAAAAAIARFELAAWLELVGGVGARFGVGRIIGAPLDEGVTHGATVAGTWGGPAAVAGAGVLLGPVVIGVGVEGGVALVQLSGTVDGSRGLGLDSPWATVAVSVGWRR